MPYDYEETFTTEEQDIVDEAVDKLREVMLERRKTEWEAYQDDKKRLAKERTEFHAQLAAFEKEKKAFEISRDTLYSQFKKDWFDTLGFQFKVGDKVWFARYTHTEEECPVCKGKKTFEVQTPYGDEITCKCPGCEGKGVIVSELVLPAPGTVNEIRVAVVRNKRDCSAQDSEIFPCNNKCVVLVSTDDRGLSEKYFSSDDLYHTKEECEAAIEQVREKEKK